VRYNEVFIPGVPMNAYSDTGYRFRYNEFDRIDNWYWGESEIKYFFDYLFYNSDTYPTPPENNQEIIAEMYFRLEVDQVSHGRVVYALMDFIGSLGGVSDLLLQIVGWIFGGYAAFHSSIATLAALYRVRSSEPSLFASSKQNDPAHPSVNRIKVAQSTRIFLFFLASPLGCVFKLCAKPRHFQILSILDAGAERKEEEFDIARMI